MRGAGLQRVFTDLFCSIKLEAEVPPHPAKGRDPEWREGVKG